jgi:hypothetical protein
VDVAGAAHASAAADPDARLDRVLRVRILVILAALIWGVTSGNLGWQSNGRATILRLKLIVAWKSRPRRSPLTARAAEPLGRVGWFGFFGIRWFTDMLEETRVLIAPSGAGKTVRLVVRLILRARGAIVATSTKPDVLQLTAWLRMVRHPFARVMARRAWCRGWGSGA